MASVALTRFDDEDGRMDVLRDALIAGEDSGEPVHFDFDDFIAARTM